jgi:translocation protein SEC72
LQNITADEQNAFKQQQYGQAAALYSRSADMALSRPPWEPSALSREETVVALCNRSAAFAYMGNFGGALADAEAVVILKRPWTKGHFRHVPFSLWKLPHRLTFTERLGLWWAWTG